MSLRCFLLSVRLNLSFYGPFGGCESTVALLENPIVVGWAEPASQPARKERKE